MVVYSAYVKANRELAQTIETRYYLPRLFASHKNPEVLASYASVALTYSYAIRLLAAYRLVKNSIINFDHYKDHNISQVNFNQLAMYDLELGSGLNSYSTA